MRSGIWSLSICASGISVAMNSKNKNGLANANPTSSPLIPPLKQYPIKAK